MNATLRGLFGLAVAMLLLGGCAVYATPHGPVGMVIRPPVFVAPLPVVVAPAHPWWGWSGRWRGSWRR